MNELGGDKNVVCLVCQQPIHPQSFEIGHCVCGMPFERLEAIKFLEKLSVKVTELKKQLEKSL